MSDRAELRRWNGPTACVPNVGASTHAPMWTRAVDRALGAWGTHTALLSSRHGGVIYQRYASRRLVEADAVAARFYLDTQAPKDHAWVQALGLDERRLSRALALIGFVDTLSQELCGKVSEPLDIDAFSRRRLAELAPDREAANPL